MKKCIILANGKPPSKSAILFLIKKGYATLICADGGANYAMKMNLLPHFIIGDLDSIHPNTYKHFEGKSNIIKISRQSDTDVEKCLKHAFKLGFSEAILTGVTGDRLDHTFCNLGIVLKFYNRIKTKILAENSLLVPLSGKNKIKTARGEILSIYGIDTNTKILSKGLKYKINNEPLPFGYKESTSNIALGESIEINVNGGTIFLIRDFKTLKQHGFI